VVKEISFVILLYFRFIFLYLFIFNSIIVLMHWIIITTLKNNSVLIFNYYYYIIVAPYLFLKVKKKYFTDIFVLLCYCFPSYSQGRNR